MTGYVAQAASLVAEGALSTVVVAALALLPGMRLASGLARRLGWGAESVPALALAVTSCVVAASATVAFALGRSLQAATAGSLVLALGAMWLGGRVGRGTHLLPRLSTHSAWIGGGATVLAVVVGPYMALGADTFYHLAAANSLAARNAPVVTDPLYGTVGRVVDPTSGAWHSMMAMWGASPFLWPGLTAVCAGVLALTLWALMRRVSGSDRAASVATIACLALGYFLDFRTAAYPKVGSLVLVLVTLLALIELAERPSLAAGGVAVIGFAATSAVHLGSAQFLFVAAGVLLVWLAVQSLASRVRTGVWRSEGLWAVLAGTAAGALAGLPSIVPRVATVTTGTGAGALTTLPRDMGGSMLQWPGGLVSIVPGGLVNGGPLFVGLATAVGLVMLWRAAGTFEERSALAGAALSLMPLVLLYDPVVMTPLFRYSPYMTERLAALLPFTPFVAVAWGLSRAGDGWSGRGPRWMAYAALAAALVFSGQVAAGTFLGLPAGSRVGARYPVYVTRLKDMRVEWGIRDAGSVAALELARLGRDYPVVAGDPETSYYLAGLARVAVMAVPKSHSPLAVESVSGPQRRADAAELLAVTTSESRRRQILRAWGAGYVALWTARPAEAAALDSMRSQQLFETVVEGDAFALLKVRE
jgi:hypothetical protein